MSAPLADRRTLFDLTRAAGLGRHRSIADATGCVRLADLAGRGTIAAPDEALRGRSVLISSRRQLPAALALLQLDGLARRVLLCPPDLAPAHLPAILADAAVDVIVSDDTGIIVSDDTGIIVSDDTGPTTQHAAGGVRHISCGTTPLPRAPAGLHDQPTEWLLFTSGTTGRPKLVMHSLASLIGPLDDGLATSPDAVWSTFYDVRRYGGLQILLRGLLGGGAMVLSQADEMPRDFLLRAAAAAVTHISGTPSHWRRALMIPDAGRIAPRYIRLSGEVADQAILDQLAARFPAASIAHAYASTEAGVGFDVRDGRAGFPASIISQTGINQTGINQTGINQTGDNQTGDNQTGSGAELRVIDGSLRIRSARTASRYLGDDRALVDADGFIDTADMLERRGDRYYFVGRREGVINVGGQKVHPEEIEAVIMLHPGVQMARVQGRANPITGALVVADIVQRPDYPHPFATLKAEILAACRERLPAHKVPVLLARVTALEIALSGKLIRHHA